MARDATSDEAKPDERGESSGVNHILDSAIRCDAVIELHVLGFDHCDGLDERLAFVGERIDHGDLKIGFTGLDRLDLDRVLLNRSD